MFVPDPDLLFGMLQQEGFGDYAERLKALMRPAIRLQTVTESEELIGVGQSKFGGMPDLPPHTPWPEKDGFPLSFLGQIRLSELHAFDKEGILPEDGLFYIFYDVEKEPWGFDPADKGGGILLYTQDEHLARRDPPTITVYIPSECGGVSEETTPVTANEFSPSGFSPCRLAMQTGWSVLDWISLETARFGYNSEELDKLMWEFLDLEKSEEPLHQMLGYPSLIQSDMETECQLATHGINSAVINVGDNDPQILSLQEGSKDWRWTIRADCGGAVKVESVNSIR